MRSFSVTDVAAMLGVNEESVRRWIREGKLVANRRIGRAGSSVELKDIIDFVNQPPRNYVKVMSDWLKAHNIEYMMVENMPSLGTAIAATTVGLLSGGMLGGTLAATALGMNRQQIVLCHSSDSKIVDAVPDVKTESRIEALPAPAEEVPANKTETNKVVPNEKHPIEPTDNYEAKIVEEQKKLIKLKQELAKINAQISITEGQIEYYRLMIQQK